MSPRRPAVPALDVVPGALSARVLASLVLVGSVLGSPNLLLDGVVRPGVSTWAYAATMLGLLVVGLVLAVRNPVIGEGWGLFLVLWGDVIYAVIVVCVADPGLVATPVMLLFTTFTAAWVLSPRTMWVQLLATTFLCWLVLHPAYGDPGVLAVQVVVNAGVLGASAVALMVLRRRTERLTRETHLLARADPLTGLPNRRHLAEQAPALWKRARDGRQRVVVLLLDLDRFKDVNDRYGHAVGDAVLVAVAGALRTALPDASLIARTGGEEVVVVALVPHPEAARGLGETLRHAVRTAPVPQVVARVTASVGVALEDSRTPRAGSDDVVEGMWRLVERADAAMYAAKAGGRDRVVVSDSRQGPGPDQLTLPIPLHRADDHPVDDAAPAAPGTAPVPEPASVGE